MTFANLRICTLHRRRAGGRSDPVPPGFLQFLCDIYIERERARERERERARERARERESERERAREREREREERERERERKAQNLKSQCPSKFTIEGYYIWDFSEFVKISCAEALLKIEEHQDMVEHQDIVENTFYTGMCFSREHILYCTTCARILFLFKKKGGETLSLLDNLCGGPPQGEGTEKIDAAAALRSPLRGLLP